MENIGKTMLGFFLFINLSFAKKAKNTQPCWILSPCIPYETQHFLVGVGSGSSIEEADTSAMGALSRQFTVQVKQSQNSTKELVQTTRDQNIVSEMDHQNLRSQTEVTSNTTLKHVQIPEHYFDKTSGLFYSLAIIERNSWLQDIDLQRNDIQSQISSLFFQMEKSDHLIDHFAYYPQLFELAQMDTWLSSQRQMIDAEAMSIPPSHTIQSLTAQRDRKIQSLYFIVASPKSLNAESLQIMTVQALQNQGLTVKNTVSSNTEAITIIPMLTSETLPKDTYGFIKIQGQIEIQIWANQRQITTVHKTVQSASQQEEKAQRLFQNALLTELESINTDIQALLKP